MRRLPFAALPLAAFLALAVSARAQPPGQAPGQPPGAPAGGQPASGAPAPQAQQPQQAQQPPQAQAPAAPSPNPAPAAPASTTVAAPLPPDSGKKQSLAEIEAEIKAHASSNAPFTRAIFMKLTQIRDPFEKPPLTSIKLVLSPLEQYPVEQMELLGVITGPKRMRALIKTPDGKTHIVARGMKVGNGGGLIRQITPVSVQVREKIRNELIGEDEILDRELKIKGKGKNGKSG